MSRCAHRAVIFAVALTVVLASPTALAEAQQAEVDMAVAPGAAGAATIWTGSQVILQLDLKTPALSFANVHFNLPDVPGALVLRTDTTTVKRSERRGGESWQVLRYPITVFPQQAGTLSVPAFEVRFDTQEGFGSTAVRHRLETPPLTLEVRQPPGLPAGQVAVTTSSLRLTSDWDLPADDLKAGDALTLTVERQAAGLSAMLMPPVPVTEVEGLAAYPADPDIDDRSNRGSLTGVRRDRITWVVEQAGDYALPAIVFRSWDPVRERLETHRVEGVSFSAAPSPRQESGAATRATQTAPGRRDGSWWRALAAALGLGLAGYLAWRFRVPLRRSATAIRVRILPPARALLKSLNPGAPS